MSQLLYVNGVLLVCANRKKCDDSLKKKLMKELHDLVRGKIKQVGRCHLSFHLAAVDLVLYFVLAVRIWATIP